MNNELETPDEHDILFKESNENYFNNAIIRTGQDNFYLFSEGYKMAAIKLFEQLDGGAYDASLLVYPLVFLNRQFIELRLKEMICGLNYVNSQKYDFSGTHNLKSLWDCYIKLVTTPGLGYIPDSFLLKNVEKLIIEFNTIDPKSSALRYPVDNSKDRNPSLSIANLDIENFVLTMKRLYNFFDIQSDDIFHLIDLTDELISDMRAQFIEDMREGYDYS